MSSRNGQGDYLQGPCHEAMQSVLTAVPRR